MTDPRMLQERGPFAQWRDFLSGKMTPGEATHHLDLRYLFEITTVPGVRVVRVSRQRDDGYFNPGVTGYEIVDTVEVDDQEEFLRWARRVLPRELELIEAASADLMLNPPAPFFRWERFADIPLLTRRRGGSF